MAKIDSSLLDRAIKFAVDAHANVERRGKGFPYIVHPMEAMVIVSSITPDQELLAAAALHDTVEDTDTTVEQLKELFGERVANLVAWESDEKLPGSDSETWHKRKQLAIDHLASAPYEAKVVAMGDKLSNMRAIAHDYAEQGDAFWNRFHVTDPKEHGWHYRGLMNSLSELAGTQPYEEFKSLVIQVFGED